MEKEAGGAGLLRTPLRSAELKEKLLVSGGGAGTQREKGLGLPGTRGWSWATPRRARSSAGFGVRSAGDSFPPEEGGARAAPHFGRKTTSRKALSCSKNLVQVLLEIQMWEIFKSHA